MITKEQQDDIQGLLKRSYKDLPETNYLMLQIGSPAKAKEWIASIANQITPASRKPTQTALHIAFTYDGIGKLFPVDQLTEPFSREFTEGVKEANRLRILGDIQENDPVNWKWNGPGKEVDLVLMIFACDKVSLLSEYAKQSLHYNASGLLEVFRLDTTNETGGKEHFGFADGLAQPMVSGFGEDNANVNPKDPNHIQAGEFIFGYKNEYGKLPFSPKLRNKSGKEVDIGKNGSYMVFRQLQQDVKGFWNFMYKENRTDPVMLASKMIGRWPNGNPLHLENDRDAAQLEKEQINNFLFKEKDPDGFGCPIGSHIRKSNPRDGIDSDPITSIAVSKRHRILRRGRPYGEPLAKSMLPDDMRAANKDGERGLYFICFNTNLSRQFEFIQHTWNNNPKFDGLYNDIDPIMGYPILQKGYAGGEFTIQACPVRKRVYNIPQFVFVKGGAYFFMPGIKTLKLLGEKDN